MQGTPLPVAVVDPHHPDLQVTVDLGGDTPLATYVTARPRGMPALQRTAAGSWIAWDENPGSLGDNRLAASRGQLTFPVTGADFSRQSFPIAISIGYKTAGGVKSGAFTMVPQP